MIIDKIFQKERRIGIVGNTVNIAQGISLIFQFLSGNIIYLFANLIFGVFAIYFHTKELIK